jgi:hypothetical protein
MWRLIDWLSDLLCRWGFHDWRAWTPNTFAGRVLMDWSRECQRCNKIEMWSGDESPDGQTHPGSTY